MICELFTAVGSRDVGGATGKRDTMDIPWF